jgi:hypothetical protein
MCNQWIRETATRKVMLMIPWLTNRVFNVVEIEIKMGALKTQFCSQHRKLVAFKRNRSYPKKDGLGFTVIHTISWK